MSEQEQDPRLPDPLGDSSQQADASQPAELRSEVESDSLPGEPSQPATASRKGPDYVSEIRQQLTSETSSKRKTGGLFRRLTRSLRRAPGATATAPEREEVPDSPAMPEPPTPPEIADDFVAGRLGGAAAASPAPLEYDPFAAGDESLPADEPARAEEVLFDDLGTAEDVPHPDAPRLADEDAADVEPDWMAEIRRGEMGEDEPNPANPAEGAPPDEKPLAEKPPARAGRLSFLTDLLHGEGRRQRDEEALSDDMVSGRLERSLGMGAEEDPTQEDAAWPPTDEIPLFAQEDQPGFERGEPDPGTVIFDEADTGNFAPPNAAGAAPPLEISAEDERLLWGETPPTASSAADGPTFRPEDVWGAEADAESPASPEPPPASRRSRGDVPSIDDLYAGAFLTGSEMPDILPQGYSQDQLLREALEQSPATEEPVSLEEIRSIALEGYEEGAALLPEDLAERASPAPAAPLDQNVLAQEAAAAAVQAQVLEDLEGQEAGPAFSLRPSVLRAWFRKRSRGERVLLIEAAVVVLVLLLAIPFFAYLVNRGPVYQSGYLIPRPLPADLPYPTRIELPGGWSFPLARSTFVAGRWKPASPEWLEGTELRRVVAVPWNEQTEAVITTFKKGDQMLLNLSNGDTLDYTITSVERVDSTDSTILSDTRPSLVLILYQENSGERWVVFSKP